jgi:Domain of unknown function (DUF5666)
MTSHIALAARTPAAIRAWRLRLAGASVVAAAALLGACGGGGGVAGVGTGGTGSFSVGTVTGFGSVFVNGVRYEDNGARLVDDDGTVKVLGSDDSPLKVGMLVEVSGSVDDSGTVRTATQIAYGAEIKGPVTAVDAAAGSFEVFGITVRSTTTTVFDNFGGIAALASGHVVEVHGQADSNGRIVATYVEREALSEAAFAAGDGVYRLRGTIAGLGGTSAGYTFTVRGVALRTDAGTDFDGTPASGGAVSVRLDPTRQGDGRYRVERLKVRSASYDDVSAQAEAEVEGYVSEFGGAAGSFRVAGYPVRLASNVVYEDGVASDLKNGIRVEAEGRIDGGVLVVTKLEFKSRDDDDDGEDDELPGAAQEFEFKGSAVCVQCGTNSGSFGIKGVSVSYDASTEFRDGLSGAMLDGKALEVRCLAQVTASGTVYRATRIELDD